MSHLKTAAKQTLIILLSAFSVITITYAATTISTNLSTDGNLTVSGTTALNGVTYTWPSSDGSASQYLQTDGSGTLSWATVSSGASADWVKESNFGTLNLTASTSIPYWAKSAIYASSTLQVASNAIFESSVGIGTTSPMTDFSLSVSASQSSGNTYGQFINVNDSSSGGNSYGLYVDNDTTGSGSGNRYGIYGAGDDYGIYGTNGTAYGYFGGGTNYGVYGYGFVGGYFDSGYSNGTGVYIYSNDFTSDGKLLSLAHSWSSFSGNMIIANMAAGSGSFTGNFIDFQKNSVTQFIVKHDGSTGIGTSTPTTMFQVATSTSNATTTMEVGKANQNKGSCLKMYDDAGAVKYVSINGTSFVISATSCE